MAQGFRPMSGWLWRTFALVTACLALACSAPAAEAPVSTPSPPSIHRIVAVGDLHGDFAAWRAIAMAAQLVDDKGRWIGGNTVLVQTGDAVDRGPASLPIIEDLMRLQKEAPRSGGRVIALVGNHEAMNMTDDLRYVSTEDYTAFIDRNSGRLRDQAYALNADAIQAGYRKQTPTMSVEAIKAAWMTATPLGMLEHQAAWHASGKIGGWVASNPAVVMLDGTLFVHGGLSAAYDSVSLDEINKRVAAALKAGDEAETSIINADNGPLWYRGLVMRETPKPVPTGAQAPPATASEPSTATPLPPTLSMEEEVDQVLKAHDARRIVVGHTPILTGIAVLYDGKLIRIDTGISAVFHGTLSYLEILDGAVLAHAVDRPASSTTGN
jgi:hypothetical protein